MAGYHLCFSSPPVYRPVRVRSRVASCPRSLTRADGSAIYTGCIACLHQLDDLAGPALDATHYTYGSRLQVAILEACRGARRVSTAVCFADELLDYKDDMVRPPEGPEVYRGSGRAVVCSVDPFSVSSLVFPLVHCILPLLWTLMLTLHLSSMRTFSLTLWATLATLLTTAVGLAPPPPARFPLRRGGGGNDSGSSGLASCSHALESSPKTVSLLVDAYAQLIGNYSDALGDAFLADSFSDTSASINYLAGLPLTAVTFPSKAAFEASQATQAKIPLVVSTINAVTKDTVVLRWTQTFGVADEPVAGISILTFVCQGGQWKLTKLYTEFNSAVYVEDIGGSCTL